jgi:hypothetical protein
VTTPIKQLIKDKLKQQGAAQIFYQLKKKFYGRRK